MFSNMPELTHSVIVNLAAPLVHRHLMLVTTPGRGAWATFSLVPLYHNQVLLYNSEYYEFIRLRETQKGVGGWVGSGGGGE